MRRTFRIGDHVSWSSEAGRVSGVIRRKITAPVQFKGYTVHASREQPQYLIQSDKTDHLAMHKGSALRKLRVSAGARPGSGPSRRETVSTSSASAAHGRRRPTTVRSAHRAARRTRPTIQTKRAYDGAASSDGYRVLVDRLWPRGVKKDVLALDAWAKELAPSDELRRWFGHDPRRWSGFVARYRRELRAPAARQTLDDLAQRAAEGTVTVVYGARDEQHNDAVVIRDEIARRLRTRAARRGPA